MIRFQGRSDYIKTMESSINCGDSDINDIFNQWTLLWIHSLKEVHFNEGTVTLSEIRQYYSYNP